MENTKNKFFRKVLSLVLASAMILPMAMTSASAETPETSAPTVKVAGINFDSRTSGASGDWTSGVNALTSGAEDLPNTITDNELFNLKNYGLLPVKGVTANSITFGTIKPAQVSKDKAAKIEYAILTPKTRFANAAVATGGDSDGDQKYKTYTVENLLKSWDIGAPQNNKFTKDYDGKALAPREYYTFVMLLTETRDLKEQVGPSGAKVNVWTANDIKDAYKYDKTKVAKGDAAGKGWVSAGLTGTEATATITQVIGFGTVQTDWAANKLKPQLKKAVKDGAVKDATKQIEQSKGPFVATSTTVTFNPEAIIPDTKAGKRNIEIGIQSGKSFYAFAILEPSGTGYAIPKDEKGNEKYSLTFNTAKYSLYDINGNRIRLNELQPNAQYTFGIRYAAYDKYASWKNYGNNKPIDGGDGTASSVWVSQKIKTAPATVIKDRDTVAQAIYKAPTTKPADVKADPETIDIYSYGEKNEIAVGETLTVYKEDIFGVLKGVNTDIDATNKAPTAKSDNKIVKNFKIDIPATSGAPAQYGKDVEINYENLNQGIPGTVTYTWQRGAKDAKGNMKWTTLKTGVYSPAKGAANFNSYSSYTVQLADVGAAAIRCQIKVPAIDAKADKTNKDFVYTTPTGKVLLTKNDPITIKGVNVQVKDAVKGNYGPAQNTVVEGDVLKVDTSTDYYPGAIVKWYEVDGDEYRAITSTASAAESWIEVPKGATNILVTVTTYNDNTVYKRELTVKTAAAAAKDVLENNLIQKSASINVDSTTVANYNELLRLQALADIYIKTAGLKEASELDASGETKYKDAYKDLGATITAYENKVISKATTAIKDLGTSTDPFVEVAIPTDKVAYITEKITAVLENTGDADINAKDAELVSVVLKTGSTNDTYVITLKKGGTTTRPTTADPTKTEAITEEVTFVFKTKAQAEAEDFINTTTPFNAKTILGYKEQDIKDATTTTTIEAFLKYWRGDSTADPAPTGLSDGAKAYVKSKWEEKDSTLKGNSDFTSLDKLIEALETKIAPTTP